MTWLMMTMTMTMTMMLMMTLTDVVDDGIDSDDVDNAATMRWG